MGSNKHNRKTGRKPGPKRRPTHSLAQKQRDERLKEKFNVFFKSLKEEKLSDDELAAHLHRVMYPVVTLLKKKWFASVNNPKQARFDPNKKERVRTLILMFKNNNCN